METRERLQNSEPSIGKFRSKHRGKFRNMAHSAATFHLGFAGSSIRSSPFHPGRFAVAAAANFGIVGNGKLSVVVQAADASLQCEAELLTNDGLYDCAWSELHEHQVVGACGDGTIKLWDLQTANQHGGRPLASLHEHSAEVCGVDWNLVRKDCFASCSWDHTIKVWEPERLVLLATLTDHTSCVYEVKWHPSHPERLLSASGDRCAASSYYGAGARPLRTIR